MTTHDTSAQEEECCPFFHPEKWNDKTFHWKNKPFIKESVRAFFHIPFPPSIQKKILKMMSLAEKENKLDPDKEESLVLFSDPTPFRSEIHLSTTGEISGAGNAPMSGTFRAKVFQGSYDQVPKFIKSMREYITREFPGKSIPNENYFAHYAYCPKCEKKFGRNYTVLFAKVEEK